MACQSVRDDILRATRLHGNVDVFLSRVVISVFTRMVSKD